MRTATWFGAGVALLLLMAVTATAQEDESMQGVLEKIAKELADNKEVNTKKVGVGTIGGSKGATPGAGIAHLLENALRKAKIKVVPPEVCELEIKGDSYVNKDGDLVLELNVKELGETVVPFTRKVRSRADVQKYGQVHGETLPKKEGDSAKKTNESRNKAVFKATTEPDTKLNKDKTQISVGKAPFAVEILVDKKPLTIALLESGHGSVKMDKGDKYVIRLHNKSEYLAAFDVTIDSLSVFDYSRERDEKDKTKPKYQYWLVPANKHFDLVGWHIDNKTKASFLVGKYGDSKREQTLKKGTIHVNCHVAWKDGEEIPKPELDGQFASESNETVLGPPIESETKELAVNVGLVKAGITLRY